MIKFKQSKDKQWYFVVTSRNGQVLVTSETYKTKSNAVKGSKALVKILLSL